MLITSFQFKLYLYLCIVCAFRWVKHISDAAETFKLRTKGNHESSEVPPGLLTMSNSSTKESLESTPEKDIIITANTEDEHLNQTNNDTSRHDKEIENVPETLHNIDTMVIHKACDNHNDSDVNVNIQSDAEKNCNDHKIDDKKSINTQKVECSNNSNNTRTLTQQSSLVAPSEVQISVSPSLTAEPVLTLNGMYLHFI